MHVRGEQVELRRARDVAWKHAGEKCDAVAVGAEHGRLRLQLPADEVSLWSLKHAVARPAGIRQVVVERLELRRARGIVEIYRTGDAASGRIRAVRDPAPEVVEKDAVVRRLLGQEGRLPGGVQA